LVFVFGIAGATEDIIIWGGQKLLGVPFCFAKTSQLGMAGIASFLVNSDRPVLINGDSGRQTREADRVMKGCLAFLFAGQKRLN